MKWSLIFCAAFVLTFVTYYGKLKSAKYSLPKTTGKACCCGSLKAELVALRIAYIIVTLKLSARIWVDEPLECFHTTDSKEELCSVSKQSATSLTTRILTGSRRP